MTHNTKECRRYNGNGNAMAAAGRKPGGAKPSAKSGGDKQMAYLTAAVESVMKKGLKKAMKSKKRKCKRTYDFPRSSDSDSE